MSSAATLRCEGVTVSDRRRVLLAPTSFELRTGTLHVAHGDPGHGHTLLALALAGRLTGYDGTVTLDGSTNAGRLQQMVALVDVPGVSEPDDNVPLRTIVGEELAMAKHRARRSAVHTWLDDNGLAEHLDARMEDLPTTARLTALARLAALRPGVRFLVLVLPERSGELADSWLPVAHRLADEGLGVVVTTSDGVARQLGVPHDTPGSALGNAAAAPDDPTDGNETEKEQA